MARRLVLASALLFSSILLAAQTGTLIPPPSLVLDGVPAISASVGADVRRYTESRSASFADWHPTRRELLISTRFGNAAQIHHVAVPGGARRQLTFFDDALATARYEPNDGRYFVFSKDSGGNEFGQLYRYDVQDGRVTRLTDGGRSQNTSVIWNHRGDRIAYTSTRRNGTDRDIFAMNPAEPSSDRRVVESTGSWSVSDWSPDDRTLAAVESRSNTSSKLWLVDVATGARTDLTPGDWSLYERPKFAPDGRGLYFTTDRGGDFLALSYMDLSTKAITPLTGEILWDIEAHDVARDGTLAFVANENGESRLYLMDGGTRKVRPASGVPQGVIGAVRWQRNGRELAFSVNSARSPSDVYSLDAGSGKVTRWTESELGGLNAAELSEPELVRWKSFDGREITGFYYHAASKFTGRRPVIVNIHGGPEGQSRPVFLARSNYYLNELGVAIVYPNVRGSTGYGKTFAALDNGMKREDSVKDIGALLDWIATRSDLDPSRVMVTGGSYGGYMTLASAVHFNDRLRCSVDVVGISNYNTFLKNTESYRRDNRRAEYGDERNPEMSAFFERTAPLVNAGRITKPLMVVAGANDPRVPKSEADQMVGRIKQNGGVVWYVVGKDEGHGFRKKPNVDYQFYATVEFVRRYLIGG